jgi:hypothetical protein
MGASYPKTTHQFNARDGYVKTVTIPTASVLTLNSVGYAIISAPNNTQLAICPFYVFGRVPAQTAYGSVHTMNIGHYVSVPTTLFNTLVTLPGTGFLDQTAATGVWATPFGTTGGVLSQGSSIGIQMSVGDPTTGTGALVIRINYIVARIY